MADYTGLQFIAVSNGRRLQSIDYIIIILYTNYYEREAI